MGVTAALVGGAIAAPIIGGLMGQQAAAANRAQQQQMIDKAYATMAQLGVPPDTARPIILQQFQSQGLLTPEMEHAVSLGPSQVAGVQTDQSLKNAQTGALQALQQRGQAGLAPEDRARLNEIRNQIQGDQQAKLQQITQNAQMRGQAGGGAELAAALQQAQAGANQGSQQGDQLAGMASQNALQAIMQSGGMAGQMQQQEFGQNLAKAQAQDEFNRFNVQNQQNVANQNVQMQNNAQAGNLANAQSLANQNVQQNNQEQYNQLQRQQSDWQNQMNRLSAISNAAAGNANQQGQIGNSIAQGYANMGAGAGQGFGSALNYYSSMNKSPKATPGNVDVSSTPFQTTQDLDASKVTG